MSCRTPEEKPVIVLAFEDAKLRARFAEELTRRECRCLHAGDVPESHFSRPTTASTWIYDLESHARRGALAEHAGWAPVDGVPVVLVCERTTAALEGALRVIRTEDVEVLLAPPAPEELDQLADAARRFAGVGSDDEVIEADAALSDPLPTAGVAATRIRPSSLAVHESGCSAAADSSDDLSLTLRRLEQVLVGTSPKIAAIRQVIAEVASTRATVMIHGESGTGKELVARAIHECSPRSAHPFVPVNMAAIPHGLAESLLFGHRKGAFTSASDSQEGWCRAADGGTLFLDEIGELETTVQPKLLRFLQEGVVQAVGSQRQQPVDVRIVTATNRDPSSIVRDGQMREDLFFRLHVVPIELPPLRERREDVPLLANLFLRESVARHDRPAEEFSSDALHMLQAFDWPGNVRQLQNTIERMVIFTRGRTVDVNQIPVEIRMAAAWYEPPRDGSAAQCPGTAVLDRLTPIQRQERVLIMEALDRTNGHVINAAKLLQIGQATVYRKIRQYEIALRRPRRPRKPR